MKEIELTRGMVALVDDEDFEYLNQWKWMAWKVRSYFYAARRLPGKRNDSRKLILMHRQIINPPVNFEVDHHDRNTLNNQRNNLRIATRSQNSANRKSCGTSKFLGVCIIKNRGYSYIRAGIKIDGKNFHIGTFKTEEEAALAYDKKAIETHGEFANLNFMNYESKADNGQSHNGQARPGK